ncbi:hypothetical protein K438DRAFT_1775302 [Mycena galopus ATCC 62051]|nr:hypothetical protein K438DRAFT_1775302 [Mycena galopus ATCC 62051]
MEFGKVEGLKEGSLECTIGQQQRSVDTEDRGWCLGVTINWREKTKVLARCWVPESLQRRTQGPTAAELGEQGAWMPELHPRIHPGSSSAQQYTRPNPCPKACRGTLHPSSPEGQSHSDLRSTTQRGEGLEDVPAWRDTRRRGCVPMLRGAGGAEVIHSERTRTPVTAQAEEGALHTQLLNDVPLESRKVGNTPQKSKGTAGFLQFRDLNPLPASKLDGGLGTPGTFYPDRRPEAREGSTRSWCKASRLVPASLYVPGSRGATSSGMHGRGSVDCAGTWVDDTARRREGSGWSSRYLELLFPNRGRRNTGGGEYGESKKKRRPEFQATAKSWKMDDMGAGKERNAAEEKEWEPRQGHRGQRFIKRCNRSAKRVPDWEVDQEPQGDGMTPRCCRQSITSAMKANRGRDQGLKLGKRREQRKRVGPQRGGNSTTWRVVHQRQRGRRRDKNDPQAVTISLATMAGVYNPDNGTARRGESQRIWKAGS